jgi:DNA-binding CsgD family transcriptional regulator
MDHVNYAPCPLYVRARSDAKRLTPRTGTDTRAAISARPQSLEPLSKSEIRVLRYLPTHLSAPEIAAELSVSVSTVKIHMRNVYAKLGRTGAPQPSSMPASWAWPSDLNCSKSAACRRTEVTTFLTS